MGKVQFREPRQRGEGYEVLRRVKDRGARTKLIKAEIQLLKHGEAL
jgi:hypothetical protein